jgi:hypothetical protein
LPLLQEAQRQMGLEEEPPAAGTGDRLRKAAARCWALLLTRHRFSGIAQRFNLRVPSLAMSPLRPAHADHRLRAGAAGDPWD